MIRYGVVKGTAWRDGVYLADVTDIRNVRLVKVADTREYPVVEEPRGDESPFRKPAVTVVDDRPGRLFVALFVLAATLCLVNIVLWSIVLASR